MLVNILILSILLLLNGFFAMAELALVSARRVRLRQMAEDQKSRGARLALSMMEDPGTFLSIAQIGMTLNSILIGAFSGATWAGTLAEQLSRIGWLAPYAAALSFVITVFGVSYLNLVLGELVPKKLGLIYAETIAVRIAGIMAFFARMTAPLVWILKVSTNLVIALLYLNKTQDMVVTEEEVKDLIAEGTEKGVFKPAEKEMIEGVMRVSDWNVRSIMTPRINMIWMGIEDGTGEHIKEIIASGYSRIPVARGDMEAVLGVVHAKDLLNAILSGKPLDIAGIMRPPVLVPDTTSVLRLLDMFRNMDQHIAIIIDEYGSVQGLVTTTDILEAITGALPESGQDDDELAFRREDGSWLIDGLMPIDKVETIIGMKNMRGEGDYHTLAGFVIDQLGRIPSAGDHFMWHEARFEVVDMDARRVDQVLVHPPVAPS